MYNGDKLILRTTIGGVADTTVAALISSGFTLSSEMVDVTTKDSGGFSKKLPGIKSASISGSGIFNDDTSFNEISNRALEGIEETYTVINTEAGKSWSGNFLIASFEVNGDTSGAVQFSISLESTGPITYLAN